MKQPAQSLRAQVSATALELEKLMYRLAELKKADPALFKRFDRALRPKLDSARGQLLELAERPGAPSPGSWQAFAEVKAGCDELLAEGLDFIHGALIRRAGLDDRLCVIADAMLDDLADRAGIEWCRLTVPSDSEFVTDLAQIVRIRAGDVSVWHLPAAAHEFGHFVGPLIKAGDRAPFAELLSKEKVGTQRWSYAHEFFSDAFATYAIGPSYAAACVMSKFHPADTNVSLSHPSHAQRVFLMLRVLGAMGREYAALVKILRASWATNSLGAGQPPEPSDFDVRYVSETADTYYSILKDNLKAVRYSGMDKARLAKTYILGDGSGAPPAVSIADALNGAWLSRIDRPVEDVNGLRRRGQLALRVASAAVPPQPRPCP